MRKCIGALVILLTIWTGNEAAAFCRVTTRPVLFGAYDTLSPQPKISEGTIIMSCSDEPSHPLFRVSIGPSGTSGVFLPRQMQSTSLTTLDYNLYTDTTFTTVWGDGTSGTVPVIQRGFKQKSIEITVYGKIPPQQDIAVETYTDTLTITVDW
jgi:spore coat protein U-like protein